MSFLAFPRIAFLAKTGLVLTNVALPGWARPSHAIPGILLACHALQELPGPAVHCHALSGLAVPCPAWPGPAFAWLSLGLSCIALPALG